VGAFIVRRLIAVFFMLVALVITTFFMFSALPANPAALSCGKNCEPAQIERIEQRLGLDETLWSQLGRYAVGIPCGRFYPAEGPILQCPAFDDSLQPQDGQFVCPAPCLGYSFRTGEDVTSIITKAMPVTISVALGAFVLFLVVGVLLGIYAALRRGRWQDRTAMGAALIGYSFPSFFIGLVLLYFVVFLPPQLFDGWQLLPYPKWTPLTENPAAWLEALILPWITLALLYAAFYARLTRNQMLETLGEDYIRTARSKGLSERTVIFKHGLRAGLTPIVTAAGLDLAFLLGGAVIVEQVFALPGLGRATIDAISDSDLQLIIGVVIVTSVIVLIANLIVDILYAAIDPRVRLT
jgi:peptide/nickel transport system permease protein